MLPVPTLLSAALVAFTVELDNELEHQMPHRTAGWGLSAGADRGAPWLISAPLWANVLQYVDPGGTRVSELHARARTTHSQLPGLTRWGYVTVSADADPVVTATPAGERAQALFAPLPGVIEARWQQRFGATAVARLRVALWAVLRHVDLDLPDHLPITIPTQNGKLEIPARRQRPASDADRDVSVLLARVLMAFALDFEAVSRLSLPIAASPLRVVTAAGVRVRDLPALTGISKEGNAMAVGFLRRRGCVVVEPSPDGGRGSVIRLTVRGETAQRNYLRNLDATQRGWQEQYGEAVITELRDSLGALVGDSPTPERSPLFAGLTPYPDGWRAKVRAPKTLPHYPMVLHRGGYPDGS